MVPNSLLHKNIRITGRVQGVGFRYSARSMARSMGIRGFVRNLPNGDVYIEAEGDYSRIEEYLKWCHQGPSRAIIKLVDVYDGEVVGFDEFVVK